jgi:8-oxo-dGTP diphosphatase
VTASPTIESGLDGDRVGRMPNRREILKIGLAVTDAERLLVVRKKGSPSYILPGGKPEDGEDDIQALEREIDEELGCRLNSATIVFLGCFSDAAADMVNTTVTVRLYTGQLVGEPSPHSEIEKLKWFCPNAESRSVLAPSLQNHIVPFLLAEGRLTAKAPTLTPLFRGRCGFFPRSVRDCLETLASCRR